MGQGMSEPLARIVLPFATPSLNQWLSMHWTKRESFKHKCRLIIRREVIAMPVKALQGLMFAREHGQIGRDIGKHAKRHPVPSEAFRRVVVKRYSAGTLDADNCTGGCKGLIDAIVSEGLLFDDGPKWCSIEYQQHEAPRGKGRTEVEVYRG